MAWDCDGDSSYHKTPYTWNHSAAHPTSESCSCYVYNVVDAGSTYYIECNITIGSSTYNGVTIYEFAYAEYSPNLYTWRIHCDGAFIGSVNFVEYAEMDLCAEYYFTDYYVKTTGNDSDDGSSWADAWLTINKAATTVPDGVTVHIGFGTYNGEPSGNKIAPQNAGTTGIKYLPETATTGGGTGSVVMEKN